LSGITKVSLHYEAHCDDPDPNPSQGLLFSSWLASRLNWKPDKGRKRLAHGGFAIPYVAPGHADNAVMVEIEARDTRRCGSGEISSLTIESTWLGKKAAFQVARSSDQAHATATKSIEGSPTVSKVVECERMTDNNVLMLELGVFDRDRAYEGALDMAASVLGGSSSKAKSAKGGT
jgi:glucose-6-phosphate dehydrogenase assembly protein OpcA